MRSPVVLDHHCYSPRREEMFLRQIDNPGKEQAQSTESRSKPSGGGKRFFLPSGVNLDLVPNRRRRNQGDLVRELPKIWAVYNDTTRSRPGPNPWRGGKAKQIEETRARRSNRAMARTGNEKQARKGTGKQRGGLPDVPRQVAPRPPRTRSRRVGSGETAPRRIWEAGEGKGALV
jgi:hypothetical protein